MEEAELPRLAGKHMLEVGILARGITGWVESG
jgi:hypothetical protein